jgi:murein DD-endopeptidase MepM/ murein hydrolase activator NlpD
MGVVFEPDSASLNVPTPLRGVVKYGGDLGVLGKSVIIDHGFGVVSVYHNLSTIEIGVGSFVEIGQAIGTMGVTGLALGTQLGTYDGYTRHSG